MKPLKILLQVLLALGVLGTLSYVLYPAPLGALMVQNAQQQAGLHSQTLTVGGVRWHVLTGGLSTGEPLVLLHGFGGDADNWLPLVQALGPEVRVIIPDLPGSGGSELNPDLDYTVPAQAARLHDLLAQMGVTRAQLAGHNIGGWIAGAYAAHYPQEVSGLLMVAPAGLPTNQELFAWADAGNPPPLIIRKPADFDARMGWLFVHPPSLPGPVRQWLIRRGIANADLQATIRKQLYAASPILNILMPHTAATQLPALVVWGADDRILHAEGAEALKELLPKTRIVLLPGIGHCPMIEAPQQVADAYRSWRASLPASP